MAKSIGDISSPSGMAARWRGSSPEITLGAGARFVGAGNRRSHLFMAFLTADAGRARGFKGFASSWGRGVPDSCRPSPTRARITPLIAGVTWPPGRAGFTAELGV